VKNIYRFRDDGTVAIFLNRKGNIFECHISACDFDLVNSYSGTWFAVKSHKALYATGMVRNSDGTREAIKMHRIIMRPSDGRVVDHINHNGLDNRRSNLRVLTDNENRQNMSGLQSNNSSGFRGVNFHRRLNKWMAYTNVDKRRIHLGYFDTAEEAGQASLEARLKYMPFTAEG
jgi:hypothetical protein